MPPRILPSGTGRVVENLPGFDGARIVTKRSTLHDIEHIFHRRAHLLQLQSFQLMLRQPHQRWLIVESRSENQLGITVLGLLSHVSCLLPQHCFAVVVHSTLDLEDHLFKVFVSGSLQVSSDAVHMRCNSVSQSRSFTTHIRSPHPMPTDSITFSLLDFDLSGSTSSRPCCTFSR